VDQLAGPEVLLEAIAALLKKPVQSERLFSRSTHAKPGS
jgi:hypothetical protein